jgi:translation initiation factor 2A
MTQAMNNVGEGVVAQPCIAVRGSQGLCLQQPPEYAINKGFVPDQSKSVKVMAFSMDGSKLAWSNMSTVQIASLGAGDRWTVHVTLPQSKVYSLAWSPLGRLLATWEQYTTTQGQEPKPNLHLWDTSTGELVKSFFQRKMSNWCPVWSADEAICSRIVNNEVQFYEAGNFESIAHKIHLKKVEDYSMSPNSKPTHVVTYVPGAKGAPSFCRLYQYPAFNDNQVMANKSFFQADKVEMKWNAPGTAVLLLTQAEVDKTGGSYYGKQQLHFMSTKGETSMVGLAKEGPIYSVQWSHDGSLFTAVYGFMPAKATMFNIKAEPVFDFGTGPRNTVLFNKQSNLLLIGGFGNLRGKVEIWDVAQKSQVSIFDAPDSTDVKWSPDGQRVLTTTCAPRLRQGNGYKVWHYTGALLHEKTFQASDELWEGDWQTSLPHPSFTISKQQVQGIKTAQPPAVKQAYRPPGARGVPGSAAPTVKPLDGEYEAAGHIKIGLAGVAVSNEKTEPLSKSAAKNKKRKEAAKKAAEAARKPGDQQGALQAAKEHKEHNNRKNQEPEQKYQGAAGLLADPDKEKKIRKLNDKISAIQKLKDKQAAGEDLEKNQLEKLSKEKELLDELNALKVS